MKCDASEDWINSWINNREWYAERLSEISWFEFRNSWIFQIYYVVAFFPDNCSAAVNCLAKMRKQHYLTWNTKLSFIFLSRTLVIYICDEIFFSLRKINSFSLRLLLTCRRRMKALKLLERDVERKQLEDLRRESFCDWPKKFTKIRPTQSGFVGWGKLLLACFHQNKNTFPVFELFFLSQHFLFVRSVFDQNRWEFAIVMKKGEKVSFLS